MRDFVTVIYDRAQIKVERHLELAQGGAVWRYLTNCRLLISRFTGGQPTRLFIFVDDLDRCPKDKAVEVLQSLVLLTEGTPFIVILAIDPRIIVSALEGIALTSTPGAVQKQGTCQIPLAFTNL